MKTNQLTQFVLGAGITLALAALLAVPASGVAADQLKGGQLQIGERPAPVPALTVAVAAPANTLACGSCTNATKPLATSAGRGAFVKTSVIVTHECPSCTTAIVTAGVGRAKTEQAVHTCVNGTVAACCSGMAGM